MQQIKLTYTSDITNSSAKLHWVNEDTAGNPIACDSYNVWVQELSNTGEVTRQGMWNVANTVTSYELNNLLSSKTYRFAVFPVLGGVAAPYPGAVVNYFNTQSATSARGTNIVSYLELSNEIRMSWDYTDYLMFVIGCGVKEQFNNNWSGGFESVTMKDITSPLVNGNPNDVTSNGGQWHYFPHNAGGLVDIDTTDTFTQTNVHLSLRSGYWSSGIPTVNYIRIFAFPHLGNGLAPVEQFIQISR